MKQPKARRHGFIRALGRIRWPFAMLGCLGLLFWPVVLFGPDLKFDPAHFIEIWLHVASEALIVVFVVEFVQDRRREHESSATIADVLEDTVLPDLTQVHSAITGVTSRGQQPTEQTDSKIHAVVETLRGLELPLRLVTDLTRGSRLQINAERLKREVDIERWSNTLVELRADSHWYDADLRDLAILTRELLKAEQTAREFADRCRNLSEG